MPVHYLVKMFTQEGKDSMEEAEEAVLTQVLLSSPHNLVKPYSRFDTTVLSETIMKIVKSFSENHTVVTWHLATDDLGQLLG